MKVTMHHPQSGVTQEASRDAFDRVWSREGWRIVEVPPAPSGPEPDDRLDALRAEAEALGLKVHPSAKAETLQRKIAEARAGQ